MSPGGKHIIKRQIIDVSLGVRDDSWELQNRMSLVFNTSTASIMGKVCDDIAANDEIIFIDRLEIDVGEISKINMESEFNERVSRLFYESLCGRVGQARYEARLHLKEGSPFMGAAGSFASAGAPAASAEDVAEDDNIVPSREYEMKLIFHFLREGVLPWWADRKSADRLEYAFIELLDTPDAALMGRLRGALSSQEARSRLIYHFSDTSLLKVSDVLAPGSYTSVQPMMRDILALSRKMKLFLRLGHNIRLFIWAHLLKRLATLNGRAFDETEFIQSLLHSLAMRLNLDFTDAVTIFRDSLKRIADEGYQLRRALVDSVDLLAKEMLINQNQPDGPGEKGAASRDISARHKPVINAEPVKNARRSVMRSRSDEKDPLFSRPASNASLDKRAGGRSEKKDVPAELHIDNAGIVILWPYLGRLFGYLKLLQSGNFVDEYAVMRAIHLLQYLATGEEKTPEYSLPLNKLLCGWQISKALERKVMLKKKEKEESLTLLNSVISHWAALKNTSIDGLREGFLKRDGVLREREVGWLLQVERKTHDILLERLPWGISVVKLPWMTTMIDIEW